MALLSPNTSLLEWPALCQGVQSEICPGRDLKPYEGTRHNCLGGDQYNAEMLFYFSFECLLHFMAILSARLTYHTKIELPNFLTYLQTLTKILLLFEENLPGIPSRRDRLENLPVLSVHRDRNELWDGLGWMQGQYQKNVYHKKKP